MNKIDRAILYGMAIGDGHISYRDRLKDGKYPYLESSLQIAHGPKQREYLLHKRQLMISILGGKEVNVRKNSHIVGGKTYHTYSWAKTNNYFRQMHKKLYSNSGKKMVTPEVLKFLDAHSLAIWIMDDGTATHNKNKAGETTSLGFELCVQSITEQECTWISDWLREAFDIDNRVCMMRGRYNVRMSTQGTLALCKTVEPYIIPCMMYKLAPSFRFVFRKSAKHPNFNPLKKGDDIVRSVEEDKPTEV